MPTNDERREVARRLRYVAEHGAPEWATTACCIAEYIGEDDYPLWNGSGLLFSKLADLIEPEEPTCERGIEMFSHAYPNEIVCDSDCVSTYVFPLTCGHAVELLENKWPSYCPHCGARVVADD